MNNLLTWQEVDTAIQNRMGNRAPSSGKRISAMIDAFGDLNSRYDLETTIRSSDVSILADGSTIYDLNELISDGDVKRIKMIRPASSDLYGGEYVKRDENKIYAEDTIGLPLSDWSDFWQDGKYCIKVNSLGDDSETTVSFTIIYYSNWMAIDSNNVFHDSISAETSYNILLPGRFKELFVQMCLELLWPQAIGIDDAEKRVALAHNKVKQQLDILGLVDDVPRKPTKRIRRIKLHPMV